MTAIVGYQICGDRVVPVVPVQGPAADAALRHSRAGDRRCYLRVINIPEGMDLREVADIAIGTVDKRHTFRDAAKRAELADPTAYLDEPIPAIDFRDLGHGRIVFAEDVRYPVA